MKSSFFSLFFGIKCHLLDFLLPLKSQQTSCSSQPTPINTFIFLNVVDIFLKRPLKSAQLSQHIHLHSKIANEEQLESEDEDFAMTTYYQTAMFVPVYLMKCSILSESLILN